MAWSAQPGDDVIPDHVSQRFFLAPRHTRSLAVSGEYLGLVVGSAKCQAGAYPVDDQQVTALGGELRARVGDQVVRLGGETDDDLAGLPPAG